MCVLSGLFYKYASKSLRYCNWVTGMIGIDFPLKKHLFWMKLHCHNWEFVSFSTWNIVISLASIAYWRYSQVLLKFEISTLKITVSINSPFMPIKGQIVLLQAFQCVFRNLIKNSVLARFNNSYRSWNIYFIGNIHNNLEIIIVPDIVNKFVTLANSKKRKIIAILISFFPQIQN